ncbi:MAG: DUF4270 domain-containing protein [Tannerella sp.]|jgi:hypothetical protein|nr:DUF4270 domain-containing protein [Tannerella sp.]
MIKGLKKRIALCGLATGLILGACDDTLTEVGTTVQPPGDLISVFTDTFQMSASTVKLDSIFAKTANCMLGEMYDPVYGTIKSDFLCQFYCEEGFKFAQTPYNGKIDSMDLIIYYSFNLSGGVSAYGDTVAPMRVSAFPVNQPLKRNFYTNDDPGQYCNMENPLGASTYTAFDMTFPDSLRNLGYYTPQIRVKLPVELGQKFYDETVNNPSTFASQASFNGFFPGIYVTNTFGSGCLIETTGENIVLRISYTYMGKDSQEQDSLIPAYQWFSSWKEVIQINRYKNSQIDQLLADNPDHTYIKSPAGVCTKLVIPTTKIADRMDIQNRFINGFTLNLKYDLPDDENSFAYVPPSHLLLLPEDSVTAFFENVRIEDNNTSFVSYGSIDGSTSAASSSAATSLGYVSDTRTYLFGNISSLLKAHIKNSPDEDLRLLVLPVRREASMSSYNSPYYTSGITHTITPSGLKIRKNEELMKIVILSSQYEDSK